MQELEFNYRKVIFIQYFGGGIIISLFLEMDILPIALTSIIYGIFIGSSISYSIASKNHYIEPSVVKRIAYIFSMICTVSSSVLFILFILIDKAFKEFDNFEKFITIVIFFIAVIFVKYANYYKFLYELKKLLESK